MAKSTMPESRSLSRPCRESIFGTTKSSGSCSAMAGTRRHNGAGAQAPMCKVKRLRTSSARASSKRDASESTMRAWRRASSPASLRRIRFFVRSNSGVPSSSSSRWIERERADCDRCSCSAAFESVPFDAIASNCLSCSSSMQPSFTMHLTQREILNEHCTSSLHGCKL